MDIGQLAVLERSFSSKIFFSICSTSFGELGFSNIKVSTISLFAIEYLLTKIYSAFLAVSILVRSSQQKLHPSASIYKKYAAVLFVQDGGIGDYRGGFPFSASVMFKITVRSLLRSASTNSGYTRC